MTDFTIGADPEVFIRDSRNLAFVSAHGMVKGTKASPQKITNKGAVQVDGVALEFNITPALNAKEFCGNIMTMKSALKNIVQKKNKDYHLCITPTATFDKDYFDSLPDTAKELGCEPDYNGWSKTINPKPQTNLPMRTASGHIHIGWRATNELEANPMATAHFDLCCEVARQLDIALLLPSLLFDSDQRRRQLYGAPGAFRPKPYGMEYRPLSNVWISHHETIHWVFDATQRAMNDLQNDCAYEKVIDDFPVVWKRYAETPAYAEDPEHVALRNYLSRFPGIYKRAA